MVDAGAVLFVCHANICRSPLAAGLLTGLAADAGVAVAARSAGVRARAGEPISPGSAVELELRGYAVPDPPHASRLVTDRLVLEADLVLTATRSQRDQLGAIAPAGWARTFALEELAALLADVANLPAPTVAAAAEAAHTRRRTPPQVSFGDLADPIGRPQTEYHACAGSIVRALAPLVRLLAGRAHPLGT